MSTSLQTTTQNVESVLNMLAPVVSAALPSAAPIVQGVQSVETVTNAVEANLAHNTAASDISVGLTALAGTPAVQNNPVIAAKLTGLALLFHNILADLEGINLSKIL